jgi:multiple sugar transport system permease protein
MAMFGAGIRSGLYIFMLRQFFIGMPKELDEAASIDGCGPLQVFTKVMIPNAIPMMVTILVFSLVWYWNDYYLSSMFFDALPPLSQKLADVSVQASFNSISGISGLNQKEFDLIKEGVMACGCLVTIIPPLVLYIFAQRYFTEGLERSGIVG